MWTAAGNGLNWDINLFIGGNVWNVTVAVKPATRFQTTDTWSIFRCLKLRSSGDITYIILLYIILYMCNVHIAHRIYFIYIASYYNIFDIIMI